MNRKPKGVAYQLERAYAHKVFEQGLSYPKTCEKLTKHFGVTVAQGSIDYFFNTNPKERRVWEKARAQTKKRKKQELVSERKELSSVINGVLKGWKAEAKKDPSFRGTLNYFWKYPNSDYDPDDIYAAFELIRKGDHYVAQLEKKTGLCYLTLHLCSEISGIAIPDGRALTKRGMPDTKVQRILKKIPIHGFNRTAKKERVSNSTVVKIAKKHGVSSPFPQGGLPDGAHLRAHSVK